MVNLPVSFGHVVGSVLGTGDTLAHDTEMIPVLMERPLQWDGCR